MAQITDLVPISGGKITDLQPIGGAFKPALEPTAQQLGADKPPDQSPGAVQRFKESFRGAQGFDPQGGFKSDVQDIGTGFKTMFEGLGGKGMGDYSQLWDTGMLLLQGLSNAQQSTADQASFEQMSSDPWTKAKGYIRGGEAMIPGVGPILSKAGDQFGSGDIAGGFGTMTPMAAFEGFKASGLANVDMAQMRDLTNKVTGAGKLIERHTSIDQGRAAVVNGQVKPALQRYVGAAQNEIKQSVNSVLQADEADAQMKGSPNTVNISKASGAANDFVAKTGRELSGPAEKLVDQATSTPARSLRDAKDFTSTVGETAAALRRSGDLQNAGALDAMYNELHKSTGSRAEELGGQYSKLWQHYIDEHRTLKTMQEGLMGEVLTEQTPAKALGKLIDPDRAAELSDIKSNMRQYNLDIDQLQKGQEAAVNLDRYSQEAKASFMGKMKAIIKHPLMAGGAALAAAKVGYASGATGLGMVLPILIAGKVSNMIDAADLTSLLSEIKKNNPVGAQRVLPASAGPMEKPPAPAAPAGNVPPPPTPKAPDFSGDIQSALQDQFKFTKNAAKNVTDSIAGKYTDLDEGLKMAIAEAVKRARNRPSTAGWEPPDEAARRGASGVNPALKSIRRNVEKPK